MVYFCGQKIPSGNADVLAVRCVQFPTLISCSRLYHLLLTLVQKNGSKEEKKISDFFSPSSPAPGQSSAPKTEKKEPEFFSSKEASKTKSE